MAILLGAIFVVSPAPIFADPPITPPIEGTVMPKVFCFKITDIRADKDDPENNKFTFEFEVLNWSNRPATDVHIALAQPDTSGVRFVSDSGTVLDNKLPGDADISDGVDEDGRPLYTAVDEFGDPFPLEDLDGDGILDFGEDMAMPGFPLGDGRLTNDLIPGNANTPNEFQRTFFSDTKIEWTDPDAELEASFIDIFLQPAYAGIGGGPCFECEGIDFLNLIGAANGANAADATQNVNDFLLSYLPAGTTIDSQGNVSPMEAIDDSVHNVRDGFVFTVDNFDDGETFQLNWFLTDFGDPIGTSFGGNDYGFGVINFARADDGGLPGPIFEGNSGFLQTQLVFFDSVYVVPDPAGMAMEPGAGITAPFVNPSDNTFGAGINAMLLSTVGGKIIPVDSTSLILAGTQSTVSWLIPVLISAIGIGIVLVRRY